MKSKTPFCMHDHDESCENCRTVIEKKETTADAIRDIYRQEQRSPSDDDD